MSELENIAGVAVMLSHHQHAAVILGGAEALARRIGYSFEPIGAALHEKTMSTIRQSLEPDVLDRYWREGRVMASDELVTYSVEFIDSTM